MTIEEAVKTLHFLKLQTGRIENEALDMALSAIRAQQEPKWISVNDRYPDKYGEVVIACIKTRYDI